MNWLLWGLQTCILVGSSYYLYRRHHQSVVIPSANDLIERIKPGLTELAQNEKSIVVWMYDLKRDRYVKYILEYDETEKKINTRIEEGATAPADVNLESGYFFNASIGNFFRRNFVILFLFRFPVSVGSDTSTTTNRPWRGRTR